MQTRKLSAAAVVQVVVAIVFAVGVLTFAGPCGVHDDGSVSPCFGTSRMLTVLGFSAALLSAVRLLVGNASARLALDVAVGVVGISIATAPGGFLALCMMATMRCHTVMRPFSIVAGVVLAVAAVADVAMALRARPSSNGTSGR